mgnify:FL=1
MFIVITLTSIISCNDNNGTWDPKTTWYKDADGDGKGDAQCYVYSDVQPEGYVDNCDDNDDDLPCDEALPFYADKDGDGLGDPNDIVWACEAPDGYVTNNDDDADWVQIDFTPVDVPDPLFYFSFDENSGNDVNNTGSLAESFPSITKTSPPDWTTTVARTGGTSALDFGTTYENYYIESESVITNLAGLEKITVTGWLNNKLDEIGSGGNRVVSWIKNGGDGFDLVYMTGGSLKIGINQWPDKSDALSSAKVTTDKNGGISNWVFFAVTYDASNGDVKYYFGDNSNKATLDKEYTYNQGAVASDIGKLCIGHFNEESKRTSRTSRMFRGAMDEIRIFNEVLSLDQVITLQLKEKEE